MQRHLFQADRYHMTQGNFSLTEHLKENLLLAEANARFYASFRKLPFAPCVGHERLVEFLSHTTIDAPRIRFLKNDRAGLASIGKYLEKNQIRGVVRTVQPGTIMFPREPFADISGHFVTAQLSEVKFEHAFDMPMTVAYRALEMRNAAGPNRSLSVFSNRRDSDVDRSVDVSRYAYIGGFNDTSAMEAGFALDQTPVGTMAHYLPQSYVGVKEIDTATGLPKHFQQICFERLLDAYPNGTTLLLDTISVELGIKHAIAAAKSSPKRTLAFKFARIDTSPVGILCRYAQKCFQQNGLHEVKLMGTGDLDRDSITKTIEQCPEIHGFGIGTKLISEVENVAGVVFKECLIDGEPTVKCSSSAKSTLPGKLQVWRFSNKEGQYILDVISTTDMNKHMVMAEFVDFTECMDNKDISCKPLLRDFWIDGMCTGVPLPDEQKLFVEEQVHRFKDLYRYPIYLSLELRTLIEKTTAHMNRDENEYPGITMPPMPDLK